MRSHEMRGQMQIHLDSDANHRALRRCHGCGSYARPFDEINGVIRCERCAQKARRDRGEEEDLTPQPVDIVV